MACWPVSPETVRRNYERIRAEVGPEVTVVAATKYVALEDMAVLAEAGIEVVGENRAQDLEAKHAVYGDAFRWHFIGRLQSRKAKIVNRICELCHSLETESAARRLEIPALVEVNLAGEETKGGVAPSELDAFLGLYRDVRGLMTMPPETGDPEASRRYFRELRALAQVHGLRRRPLLLLPPRRQAARRAWRAGPCRLRPSGGTTSASAPRSARR